MKTIIVTGAAGYLGSHICEHYLKKDFLVVGLDNLSTGSAENISLLESMSSNFKFYNFDVCLDWAQLNMHTPDLKYIFHFASPASPPLYQKLSLETLWVNSIGLGHAIAYANKHKARVVFASTSEVYGDPTVSPQPETYWGNVNSFGERSCYDESKRFGEALIFSHNKRHNTKHGLIRFFNSYGPRMNPSDGRVMINFIQQATKNEPLTIYGDGSQTRSFCYIDDSLSGIVAYAESNITEPINIGNDTEYSVLELAKKVTEVTKSQSKFVYLPLPKDDPKKRKPDLTKAYSLLKPWKPKTELTEGIQKMAAWVSSLK